MTDAMRASEQLPREFIDSELAKIPGRRVGKPEDIAGVVAMLLSEDGRWINGQVCHVNGGALMR
ncbi:MAG: SDR family oxidoreductase [Gammaproteobacteria bacterium]|nr:SDR family oxidoreductase [Gammaproteobacteria bacterium]MBK9470554.1 SDR family oxidoreductase [Gammaproteobacteria bacterium]